MQTLAQTWLVLKLTNSGSALGFVLALQFLPMLLLTPFGGLIADIFSKRKTLFITQSLSGILALILGILVFIDQVQLWMVYLFALFLGLINSVDNPVRQSFISEMVGKDEVKNAVSLFAVLVSTSRFIGPAIAGVLIATISLSLCFILNALSFIAIIIALFMMRKEELYTNLEIKNKKGQLIEGFRYVKNTPILFNTLMMMAIIGTLTFEFQVSLPLLAKFTLLGDAKIYAALTCALALGSIFGGLVVASNKKISFKMIINVAFLFGIFVLITSISLNLIMALLSLIFVGFFSIMFISLGNSILQLNSDSSMRGRVMALWAIAFLGSTAIGGPIIGLVGEYFGPRWALAVGGVAAIIAAIFGLIQQIKESKKDFFESK